MASAEARAALEHRYHALGLWTQERLGYMMSSAARRWPQRELICFEGRRYRYAELHAWSIAAAQNLICRGIGPGDRVLLHLSNCMELLVLQLAVWRIGAVSVPVIPIYREHEMRYIVADCQPRLVVAMARVGDRSPVEEFDRLFAETLVSPPMRIVIGAPEVIPGWDSCVPLPPADASADESGLPEPAGADEVSLILYTSGTTSAPKGAMLTGRALMSNADNWRTTLGLSQHDVALAGSPLAHIAALSVAFLVPLRIGGRTVILQGWNADRAAELIVSEGATYMAGATVFLRDLVERFQSKPLPAGQLKFYSGGAATPPMLVEQAERVGILAARAYGMTETAGTCTLAPCDSPLERRSQFDGQLEFGMEMKVVDDAGMPVPFGTLGHVHIRSPQLMVAYTDAKVTAAQLDGEGWFDTGDMGVLDPDGWFRMDGRTKDIINRGGEKFSSRDIEAAVLSHPSMAAVAVVGVPHPRFGEEVAACVVLRSDAKWEGPEALIEHLLRQRMAKAKMPTRWLVLDNLPMTATGKVQKQVLLRRFAEA